MYDIYAPIVKDIDIGISYEDAKATVLEALRPLGEDYLKIVREGFENRWIDVYENEGKRGGAFSAGCRDTNPYILLNFDGKISDMFTLAHEMGHSMHSHHSKTAQSPTYSDYPIFLAEVASTVNEALLMEHLLKTTTDKRMREYLYNYYLEQFKSTLFRQTMFSEFEMTAHESAESGEPLTVDYLKDLYLGLNKRYFGGGMVSDDKIAYEWSRIPHFYRAFYVYKYATGYSAAIAFSRKILTEGKPAVDAYRGFLSSGSSDYPIEILKKAGVDMSKPEPVEQALKLFGEIISEMEKL
jgi:oligoendopeptidase F